MPSTDPARRRFLKGVASVPLLAGVAVAVTRLGSHAAMVRPGGRGASSQRCGACGSWEHTMLQAACPATPEVM